MPLYEGDVSEYVQEPRVPPVELAITIGRRASDGYPVTAVTRNSEAQGKFVPPLLDADRPESPSTVDPVQATTAAVATGSALFDALFSGPLRRAWAEALGEAATRAEAKAVEAKVLGRAKDVPAGLALRISGEDDEIHGLAWELLYDHVLVKGFVAAAEGWELTRSVPGQPRRTDTLESVNELRVLLVAADQGGQEELDLLRTALPGAEIRMITNPTMTAVAEEMAELRPHLVHFRTYVMSSVTDAPRLLLGDPSALEEVQAARLLEPFNGYRPWLVVLASDYTDVLGAELAREVPCVVGMRGSPQGLSRDTFFLGFYRALSKGATLSRAMSAGRAQQMVFAKALSADWAAPVAFLASPGGIISPPSPSARPHVVRTIVPEAFEIASDSPRIRELHVALDMHTHSREALIGRWQSKRAEWPDFIAKQVEQLDRRITEIKTELGDRR